MIQYIGSFKPVLHFSSKQYSPLSYRMNVKKITNKQRCITSPTQINIGNYRLHCDVILFP